MTVMKTSMMLVNLHHCTPALIVVSVREKMWFGILSLTTTINILSRETRVISLPSNWLPCTTSLRWTHCVGLQNSRWKIMRFLGRCIPAVARADPNLVHSWYVRPIEFGRRGCCGGSSETDSELR